MVFLNKIGSWSYELKNIFPTYRKPGSSLYNLEKIEEKRFWKKKKKVLHWKWECCVYSLKYELSVLQEIYGKGTEDVRS